MTDKQEQTATTDTAGISEEIQRIVESGLNVQDKVREITLKALSEGKWDTDAMRAVAQAVADGAKQGAQTHGERADEAMRDAMEGLDAAFAKAAQASQLALEEAFSLSKEYSAKELRTTLDNMKELESMFIDTMKQAAEDGQDLASQTLHNLAGHMRRSGSAVGAQVKESLDILGDRVVEVEKARLAAGVETMRTTGALFTRIAAGMLTGLADVLQPDQKTPGNGGDTPASNAPSGNAPSGNAPSGKTSPADDR